MGFIGSVLLKYKWYILSFILGAGLLIGAMSYRRRGAAQRLIRWVSEKRFQMVEGAIKIKRDEADVLDSEVESIDAKLDAVRKEKDGIGEAVDVSTLQELSTMWKELGY